MIVHVLFITFQASILDDLLMDFSSDCPSMFGPSTFKNIGISLVRMRCSQNHIFIKKMKNIFSLDEFWSHLLMVFHEFSILFRHRFLHWFLDGFWMDFGPKKTPNHTPGTSLLAPFSRPFSDIDFFNFHSVFYLFDCDSIFFIFFASSFLILSLAVIKAHPKMFDPGHNHGDLEFS